jgi:hypothetical protein
MLRRRLEDTTGTPLWDDDTLNDVLADALGQYGVRFPAEQTASAASMAGSVVVPFSPYLEGREIVRVLDPGGRLVARMRWAVTEPAWSVAQAWRWWNGTLILQHPATGGTWQVDYLARRELPDDDVTAVDIRTGDEEIVVLLAAAGALLRRAVEQGKRGLESAGLALTRVAECHAREAERLMAARRRRAAGGWLGE